MCLTTGVQSNDVPVTPVTEDRLKDRRPSLENEEFMRSYTKLAEEFFLFYMKNIPLANRKARNLRKLVNSFRNKNIEKFIFCLKEIANSKSDTASLYAAIDLYQYDKETALSVGRRHAYGNSSVENTANRWIDNIEKGFFRG
jgi:hypothetical protein